MGARGHAGEPAGAARRGGGRCRRAARSFDPDDAVFLPPGDMPARIAAACRRSRPARAAESRPALVRCILDSLAAAFARRSATLAGCPGSAVEVVHLVGGGARNALLCQLTADACELPVVAGPVEATALGNVLVQARAARAALGRPRGRSGRSSGRPRTSGATSRGRPWPGAEPEPVRIALFITCFNDLLFPEVGKAMVTAPAPARPRGRVSRRPDLLRPDALQLRLPRRVRAAGRAASPTRSRATTRSSRRRPRAPSMVRHHHALVAGLPAADASLPGRVAEVAPRVSS